MNTASARKGGDLAELLGIPGELLWFKLPDQSKNPPTTLPAAADRSAVIAEIRACRVAELADFRRPPTLAELADALPGPVVVVNVSEYRSDALILAGGKLRVLECPGLTPAALRRHLTRFDKALADLAGAWEEAMALLDRALA